MGPSRAERRRERFILGHILILSILSVIGLWGFFGVISPPGEWVRDHWCGVYWRSWDEAEQYRALEHLFDDTSPRAERAFNRALDGSSDRIQRLARRWYEVHGKSPLVE